MIKQCRACNGEKLVEFLNLGKQYLADFRGDDKKPPSYPLVAVFCEDCKLVQLKHPTPQSEMYHENYGFKSGVSDSIKKDLDSIVTHAFQYHNDPKTWLDIASNDGTLLSFVPEDVYRVGVDPVGFLCKEAEKHADKIINDYFTSDPFTTYEVDNSARYDKFDVITSISCFYDMPDPNKFVSDVKKVLAVGGVWVIQQNYLLATMKYAAVDNFCAEHVEYYTLLSLENLLNKHDLQVNEVLVSDVNGGSIRTIVSHKGTFPEEESVGAQRVIEDNYALESIKPYKEFAGRVGKELERLRGLIAGYKSEGKVIAILAASTRGATIWQSAGIDEKLISYAVERNPAKVGKNFSQIGVPIISEEEFRKLQPEVAIVGPWFFYPEIVKREYDYVKNGGTLIIPLPEVKIVNKNNIDEVLNG